MAYTHIRGNHENIFIGKILCIGQNYAEHAKEMQTAVSSDPVFFLKPPTAVIHDHEQVILPPRSENVQHEVELTVLIGKNGKNISPNDAPDYIAGYGIGLDMTMRDIQAEAKKLGQPWTLAKGFDTSAPISDFLPAASVGNPQSLAVRLHVNGTQKQYSSVNKLIFPVDILISYISQFITLERGDIIFTGTPEGVSKVSHGDQLEAVLLNTDGKELLTLHVSIHSSR